MDVKISVLVPVYNVESTLERCMDSILNQTFKDYEIILVDDGSPDKSGEICDRYAEEYPFVSVIHKENEGLGPTRNAGVKAARGKYIYHCDSDDWIAPDLLEKAYANAEANNSDVVVFGYTMYTENENGEKAEYQSITVPDGVFTTQEESREFFASQFSNSFVVQSACNRLIKRQFLIDNNIWFKPFRRSQDVVFSVDLFSAVTRLSTMHESFYNYIITPGVYKGRSFDEMISIFLDVSELVLKAFENWNMLDTKRKNDLTKLYVSHIANYTSYYIMKKSENPKSDLKKFMNDERVRKLILSVDKNILKSNFLSLVFFGIKYKSALILKTAFSVQQKRSAQ